MRIALYLVTVLLLAGCSTSNNRSGTIDAIEREMDDAAKANVQPSKAEAVNDALMPPLAVAMPRVGDKPLETKFDLNVSNASVNQVFSAIVSGTRYSMLLHPEVGGSISLNLKDVTVFEALETIREIYGYDYKVDGTHIYIMPLTLQTRIFQVSYLTGQREGKSSLRVASGSVADVAIGGTGGTGGTGTGATTSSANRDSSKVTMTSSADFWEELSKALKAIVGEEKGRSIVVSPMSGVIVVRAMPDELKNVAAYLKASQISIERQVILEAKIVEVQLNDVFQSGVNWASFKSNSLNRSSVGQLSSGTNLALTGALTNGLVTSTPGTNLTLAGAAGQATGSLFGLAFQTSNFAALLNFLESQGNVHVLSSPRIATLNNQKAVLKVGTDEFFVTEVTGGTQATSTVAGTAPSVKVQPFFSGIALDVTPRIDENNEIILHVHPSVSTVSTVNKLVDLGTSMGTYNLPLASSSVSETDSVVRARDGQIVAIGGLMRQATQDDESGLPMLPKSIFGQTSKHTEKRELVILLKPTVVDSDKDWSDDITRSRDRFSSMNGRGTKP
ncbi:MAG: secretin N-terminal domain-containing protein [Nitrosomonadales bacterium]|nr:secretin N-terminal domain-containing protein [Nitrosomonadales bacterium]